MNDYRREFERDCAESLAFIDANFDDESLILNSRDALLDGYLAGRKARDSYVAALEKSLNDHVLWLKEAREAEAQPEITGQMKAACIGEFTVDAIATCTSCSFGEPQEDCEVCDGSTEYTITLPVPWTTIKDIYRAMCAASPPKSEAPALQGSLMASTHSNRNPIPDSVDASKAPALQPLDVEDVTNLIMYHTISHETEATEAAEAICAQFAAN